MSSSDNKRKPFVLIVLCIIFISLELFGFYFCATSLVNNLDNLFHQKALDYYTKLNLMNPSASILSGDQHSPYYTSSKGEIRIPVFIVDFPDERFDDDNQTQAEIERMLFDDNNPDSMTSFYRNASYGKLHISGDVRYYTAKKRIEKYEDKKVLFEKLAMEVLTTFENDLDYSKYDNNHDGTIDAFAMTIAGYRSYWDSCNSYWDENWNFKVDSLRPAQIIINNEPPDSYEINDFVGTMCHEFGHSMGLEDYYKYVEDYGDEAFEGIAGAELMDDAEGDLCQFSKLIMGWLDKENLNVYKPQKNEFTLRSAQTSGDFLIIPRNISNDNDSIGNEYFLVEFNTAELNMKNALVNEKTGVRIFHIDAEKIDDSRMDKEYKYSNFSDFYDKSHKGRRLLRLVNNGKGYFSKDSVINNTIKGFAWYDDKGKETIDPGLQIKIQFSDDKKSVKCTVTAK